MLIIHRKLNRTVVKNETSRKKRRSIERRFLPFYRMAYRYSRSACSSFPSAFFSMRDTFRRACCKGFAVRNSFRFTEAEFDNDLFVFSQLYSLDETDQ